MKRTYFPLIALFLLVGCSKEELFGSKEGPDAYRIQTFQKLTPVEQSLNEASVLPKPTTEPTQKLRPVQTASEILDLKTGQANTISNDELYQKLNTPKKSVDLAKFDNEMKETYKKEKEDKVTPLDTILGKEDRLLDPITNPKKDEPMLGLFSF